jgi:hypothetical protein
MAPKFGANMGLLKHGFSRNQGPRNAIINGDKIDLEPDFESGGSCRPRMHVQESAK